MRFFSKKKTVELPLTKLWVMGIVIWLGWLVFSVFTLLTLSKNGQIIIVVSDIAFSAYFIYVIYQAYSKSIRTNLKHGKHYFRVILTLIILLFVAQNIIPRRIEPNADFIDSPFDEFWFSGTQQSFGFPYPVVRFFDEDIPGLNNPYWDIPSLFSNIFLLTLALYLLIGLYLLIPKLRN